MHCKRNLFYHKHQIMITLKDIKNSSKVELTNISLMFESGLITPMERFRMEFSCKESLKRVIRMTTN